ncbi:Uncharacterised protein [Dermatophilus congolensis]|uniref:Uncharacterized protein n=1 Tax=Dermatophilus congolensis TaxID=1863 RepID=A0AA46H033_9MICO|nr:Uncharacterised protein [Dermatophilus congolensis]
MVVDVVLVDARVVFLNFSFPFSFVKKGLNP